MKKLIKGFIFLVLIAFTSLFVFEYLLRNIPNDYSQKADYLENNGDKIETLILGSSHSFYGINPNLINNSYNLAHSSKSYDLDWKILEKYQTKLPNLKTIILSSSYFSFVHTIENSNQKHLLKNYSIYYGLDINSSDFKSKTETYNSSFYDNLDRLKYYYFDGKRNLSIDEKGYIKSRKHFNPYKYNSSETVKKHTNSFNPEVVNENINGLKNILQFAKENKIKVILVTTPTSPTYKENLNQTQLKHWIKTTNNLIEDYDRVIWLNFMKKNTNFNRSDFVDSDHLSLKGANKVTSIIKRYI